MKVSRCHSRTLMHFMQDTDAVLQSISAQSRQACVCGIVCVFRNEMVLFPLVPCCVSELSSKALFVVTVRVYRGEGAHLKCLADKLF